MTPRKLSDERGSVTVLLIGFTLVLAVLVAVVVNASAAFLQRQGLDTLADGAALYGADLGAAGEDAYDGLDHDRLELSAPEVRTSVASYLNEVGAYRTYPGLTFEVAVDTADRRVTVEIHAPLDLPLTVPGSPASTMVGATGSAVVDIDG